MRLASFITDVSDFPPAPGGCFEIFDDFALQCVEAKECQEIFKFRMTRSEDGYRNNKVFSKFVERYACTLHKNKHIDRIEHDVGIFKQGTWRTWFQVPC